MLDILGILGYSVRFTLGLKEERTLFQSGQYINPFRTSKNEEFTDKKVGGAHHEEESFRHRLDHFGFGFGCLRFRYGCS